MWFLYRIVIRCFFFIIRISSLWRKDAKKWKEGRTNLFTNLQQIIQEKGLQQQSFTWFHVASLGEFEQGRSLIELIKKNNPSEKIFISFFSPSGYDIQKNYENADVVTYFPSDIPSEIEKFINLINPKKVIFVKYEFWWNCLRYLHSKKIPYYFISLHLSQNNYLRKNFFSSFLSELKNSSGLFIQTEENYKFFKSKGFSNIHLTGDTRLDRVLEIADSNYEIPEIIEFKSNQRLFIIGSAWQHEIDILSECMSNKILDHWKIIIAPHKVDSEAIFKVQSKFQSISCLYSSIQNDKKILIINSIGLLSKLYRYADLAFIGGGFGKGIHNTLEPIAHKVPVCFGPKYRKFPEAIEFIKIGVGFEINSSDELIELIQQLTNPNESIKTTINSWIDKSKGSSLQILKKITEITSL